MIPNIQYIGMHMLTIYYIKTIMIGIKLKLQEQLQYESFICLMSVHRFVGILIVT